MMVSAGGIEGSKEVQGELWATKTSNGNQSHGHTPLCISTSQKGLLSDFDSQSGFQDLEVNLPSNLSLLKLSSAGGLASPSARFRRLAQERDDFSRSVPSSSPRHGFRERLNRVLSRKIDWASLGKTSKKWIKNPLNMVLLLWISSVAVSGAILFLVMTGMLNNVLPTKSQRNVWFEVNNQILNALFTLMCLYQHPKRFHHLLLLCRWRSKDISRLRNIYCKNGTYKPHEWTHMMVVIVLLHVNCVAQYALCGLNLGYKRSERPAVGVGLCLSVAIAAPAIASLYSILSPLGRDYDLEVDEEAQERDLNAGTSQASHLGVKSFERRFSFASRDDQNIVENKPEWRGGIFDFWEDIRLAYLSLFCSFCVFGWNMERLGFGNMYVHIATFILFCTAPFWIFNLAAVNIDNDSVREALGVTGIALCVFGLLYGGFWRIQMRQRFNLPANKSCGVEPAIADCAQWLFCCWCSLAQEVRTADFYDIMDDKFCKKQADESFKSPISPLPRENGLLQFRSGPSSPLGNSPRPPKLWTEESLGLSRFSKDQPTVDREFPELQAAFSVKGTDDSMRPPVPSFIRKE
ncbi:hypothetical protein RJ640_010305 [Escallonia rubra]|uniref:PLAC8 motif-containing protein n=1 Tax=Escallonia rubra TaxID=112253 RepID=A0AA88R999_9ASTE|nr:hypothetical protein RJ640_010305 [Escallonia rubra]